MSTGHFSMWLVGRSLLALLSASVIASCAIRPPAQVQNNKNLTSVVAASSPTVLAANERISQAAANEAIARSELLPKLNLKGTLTSYLHDESATTSLAGANSAGLSLTLPITGSIAGISGMRAASANSNAQIEAFRSAEANAILRIVGSVATLDKARQTAAILEEQWDELNRFLSRQVRRKKAGEISSTSLEQIKARVSAIGGRMIAARSEQADASARLSAITAGFPMDRIRPIDARKYLPASAQQAVEIAVAENPRLREAVWRQDSAKYDIGTTIRDVGPDLSFSINANIYDQQYVDGTAANGKNVDARLELKVPLFDGGSGFAKASIKESAYRERMFEARAAFLDTEANVRALWEQTNGLVNIVTYASERVTRSQRAYAGVKEAERVGALSIDQSLQAFNDLTDARLALIETRYQLLVQTHELLAAMGRLQKAYKFEQ